MTAAMDPDAPSVLTSEVYNAAEVIFNMLQNKEKLVSFLDCTTLLRGMGMNPTHEDMDKLKELMAQPILRLEQWRREEELKREKERRKEEARERKGKARASVALGRKSIVKKVTDPAAEAAPVDITPAEEIKNIDWNIFIRCTEMIFRDRMREERAVLEALKVFAGDSSAIMSRDRLIEIVTTNGDNVFTPTEVKMLVAMLPESCPVKEWARRIEGTYVAPTQEEIDAAAMREIEARRQQGAAEKQETEKDPLEGL
ncbi:protein of unknown function - conserved [Leishmania donovani]|uniref:Uncharacterized protein n=3 Tax=Leishmania donovani species complex TaxID=38574 RepID=A4HY34_LEIIN|nr:conserved hypothetical protein [Leishmania infantum JPCM5]XP_003860177.1 hypothetical protein, conserved [Leishmania donovani]CAC9481831.1 hypothetical_protein_-_conserved [Leishmania infantum]AYU78092.1 hypothetical protein LdCL_180021600 [Leishmania donovani]TPP55193.1 hypothetical protein CGC20_38970 [Leishmania donovani]CAJ1988109.1 protein of unknown function - conserved [Leishmania donovani]CAM67217.1 conserved hypothetical protein [Leishmania infantum JPCM5]|eukprot:XP_001464975.1 conserved hypothetical protein [Leishmania infantum JPCM5]